MLLIWSNWHSSCDYWSNISLSCWFLSHWNWGTSWETGCTGLSDAMSVVLNPSCILGPPGEIWKVLLYNPHLDQHIVISVRPKYSLAELCFFLFNFVLWKISNMHDSSKIVNCQVPITQLQHFWTHDQSACITCIAVTTPSLPSRLF